MFIKYSPRVRSVGMMIAFLFIGDTVPFVFAQASTATLNGLVQDQTGAVLPNVTITATSTKQNTSQSTRTNEVGAYLMPAINPGKYSITAELPGFKTLVH